MIAGVIAQVGATVALSKEISEADVALFALVTDDHIPAVDDQPPAAPQGPSLVPSSLVAALLAAAAVRHAGGLATASIARAEVSCTAPAHTEDTLRAVAEVVAYDAATQLLRVRAHCTDQLGRSLAEGTFDLRIGG